MKLTEEQKKEIKEQQSQQNTTKRVTAPELEKILYDAIPILDHGFIRVVDYMGDDTSVVQSARVSYGKGTKKVSTDSGLIKYLMRHWHSTPFEMCEIKYHIKLPIFIARQWIRHRTANVNEYSARYSILDKEFYLPEPKNLAAQSQINRQGRGEILEGDQAKKVLELFPENTALHRWITLAREKVQFQGLPSRICWLGYGERAKFGLEINKMVREGKLKAPIVIGRDHLDCGSVASPNRETESMLDGSDTVGDWPILNALLNTASGATWVSFHHGGGVGMGYSLHAGQVIVADGSKEMDRRINSVLTNDPGMGIFRHADSGYDIAIKNAKKWNVSIPIKK